MLIWGLYRDYLGLYRVQGYIETLRPKWNQTEKKLKVTWEVRIWGL